MKIRARADRCPSSLVLTIFALVATCALCRPAQGAPQVDLNHATVEQLITLPGIGSRRAQAILLYRERHGFRRPADLLRVRGIGRRIYRKLKPLVKVVPRLAPKDAMDPAPLGREPKPKP